MEDEDDEEEILESKEDGRGLGEEPGSTRVEVEDEEAARGGTGTRIGWGGELLREEIGGDNDDGIGLSFIGNSSRDTLLPVYLDDENV